MLYSGLVAFYERLSATRRRLEMTTILVSLLSEVPPQDLAPAILLTQGKIAPDFEGLELGVAEKLVIRVLVDVTGLPDDAVVARQRETGDLGDAAEGLVRRAREGKPKKGPGSRSGPAAVRQVTLFEAGNEPTKVEPLTVADVYATLGDIARASGAGSQEAKTTQLRQLLLRAEPLEAKYIVRTVTGKLRLGVADMTLLDALAVAVSERPEAAASAAPPRAPTVEVPAGGGKRAGARRHGPAGAHDAAPAPSPAEAASTGLDEERLRELRTTESYRSTRGAIEHAYNIQSDLALVAQTLAAGGLEAVERARMTVGVPIRPMLAERLSEPGEILEKLHGEGAIEWKYDGLRVQAHIRAGEPVKLFSRRLENLSDQFPDVAKALREAFRGREAIVEGEMVPVEADTGAIRPFQEIATRRGRKHGLATAMEEVPVTAFLFDCLLLDGEDLAARPLPERRRALEGAFQSSEHVTFSSYHVVSTREELDRLFLDALEEGAEGIMAKSVGPDSTYRAGSRGWQWIKYKRDYRAELSDSLDLVVVGAFAGRGRRKGWYGALLMAAYNPDEDVFETVCKLGTGFDDPLLASMPQMFRDHLLVERHPRVHSKLEADFWFEPALVAEVRGAELTLSPVHTAAEGRFRDGSGLALRFPRFMGNWRGDKRPEDATTIAELGEMYQQQRHGSAATGDGSGDESRTEDGDER
ncbi:MAG: ATP-dependent DNA ligase [Thermoplasmatota archaeon]